MRKVTPEMIQEQKLNLSKLEDDWSRLNRPSVHKGLRDSLYTRILELRAHVDTLESQTRKMRKAGGKEATTA